MVELIWLNRDDPFLIIHNNNNNNNNSINVQYDGNKVLTIRIINIIMVLWYHSY